MAVDVITNILFNSALIALFAISFSIVYKITKVFTISQGAVFLVSSYLSIFISKFIDSVSLLIIVSIFICFITNILIDFLVFHRYEKSETSGSVRLIGSLSILVITAGVISLLFGNQNIPFDIFNIKNYSLLNHSISSFDLLTVFFTAFLTTTIGLYFAFSKNGVIIKAIVDNVKLASLLGYNVRTYKILGYFISSVFLGTASILFTLRYGIDPSSAWPVTITAAIAVIFGGESIILGPIIGSVLIGSLKSLNTIYLTDRWNDTIIYLILLVLLLVKSKSIFK
jgi:branched-chain amino acid transport system permease protein